jgi:hypothetical protein
MPNRDIAKSSTGRSIRLKRAGQSDGLSGDRSAGSEDAREERAIAGERREFARWWVMILASSEICRW